MPITAEMPDGIKAEINRTIILILMRIPIFFI